MAKKFSDFSEAAAPSAGEYLAGYDPSGNVRTPASAFATAAQGAAADAALPAAERGAANGVAPLGNDGKIPDSYIPTSVLGQVEYKGVWDASGGTAPAASPENGQYWIVTVAGTTALDGIEDWKVGDWAIYTAGAWKKVDNTDAVSSVAGLTGIVSAASLKAALGLGSAAYAATSAFATAAQGATADSALQASDRPVEAQINAQTGTTYTFALGDAASGALATFDNANPVTVTLAASATVPFAIGAVVSFMQLGLGAVTLAPATGVSIVSEGSSLALATQGAGATLVYLGGDSWWLVGSLA